MTRNRFILRDSTCSQGCSGAGTRWNAVPANILEPERRSGRYRWPQGTGGTLTLKRSGKSRRTRYVDPRSVYFLAQIAPKRGIWHQKSKKNCRGDTPGPPQREGATRRARGRKLPRCWDLGLGNRSPKSKFTTTPLRAAED